jgi:FkbM family methyltransferase
MSLIQKASRKVRHILYLIRYFRNWSDLALLALQGKRPAEIVLRNGIVIRAPEDNAVLRVVKDIFIDQVYTPSGMEIRETDVVVDIGANIGVFSLFAAGKTRNAIYSFEPFPANFEFLTRNIQLNGITTITASCLAISDMSATAKLYVSDTSGGHLLFDHNITGELKTYVEVPANTLEGIMSDHSIDYIDFLKLDAEGSEGQILGSTPARCLERIGKIAMEFHDNVSILDHDEIRRLLEDTGFSCRLRWDRTSPFGYLYAKRV